MVEQLSIFDLLEKRPSKEYIINWALLIGSGFKNGKQRIVNEYNTRSSIEDFAAFLKEEYGDGGSYCNGLFAESSPGGFKCGRHNDFEVRFSWREMAKRIGKLIESGEYFKYADSMGVIYG